MEIKSKTFRFGRHQITLETGRIARQSDASVFASMDDTQVLASVVAKKEPTIGRSFFPLSVNYIEKSYATGKVPGGYLKREGRPNEKEILTSRLIDRPIRPLFPDDFTNEVQIIITVLSANTETDPDIIAMIAASTALAISGLPFTGPVGAVRVGYQDDNYLLNPTYSELKNSSLNMVVAGTQHAVLMVESEAKELSEAIMLGAVMYAHKSFQVVIENIKKFAEEVNNPIMVWQRTNINDGLYQNLKEAFNADISEAYKMIEKLTRYQKINEIKMLAQEKFINDELNISSDDINKCIQKIEGTIVRTRILNGEKRIDGRDNETVRPLRIERGVLANTHGSALFTRGETQALVVTTLGSKKDAQLVETLEANSRQEDYFLLHYNFPPYCVGETGMIGSTKRREIGHGRLARRSIFACLPSIEDYPYTIRVVSEITESNGSSSMASVCGASLALLDAGVPLKAPVAGIAMGLVKDENSDKFQVLTDILGDEDHLGDMDFKVAGTSSGINALQMDIKISGITEEIMSIALKQARKARLYILGEMNKIICEANTTSKNAPKTKTLTIDKGKIRDLIGKGGETIKSIIAETGASIDVNDEGVVTIFANKEKDFKQALSMVERVTEVAEVGKIYEGLISKIVDFGAFISILPNQDGLLHISEIAHERVNNINDYFQEGEKIKVKVISIERDRIKLSRKVLIEKK